MSDGYDLDPDNVLMNYLSNPTVTDIAVKVIQGIGIFVWASGLTSVILWYTLIILIAILLLLRCFIQTKKIQKADNVSKQNTSVRKSISSSPKKPKSFEKLPNSDSSVGIPYDAMNKFYELSITTPDFNSDDELQPMVEMKEVNMEDTPTFGTAIDFSAPFIRPDIELEETKFTESEILDMKSKSESFSSESELDPETESESESSDTEPEEESGAVLYQKEEIAKDQNNLENEDGSDSLTDSYTEGSYTEEALTPKKRSIIEDSDSASGSESEDNPPPAPEDDDISYSESDKSEDVIPNLGSSTSTKEGVGEVFRLSKYNYKFNNEFFFFEGNKEFDLCDVDKMIKTGNSLKISLVNGKTCMVECDFVDDFSKELITEIDKIEYETGSSDENENE